MISVQDRAQRLLELAQKISEPIPARRGPMPL